MSVNRIGFYLAILFLGVVLGASSTSVAIGKQVDSLIIENRSLIEKLSVTEKEIKEIRENNDAKHKRIITKISTQVTFSEKCSLTEYEQSTIELFVEKKVREWLEIINGQEVETVNYSLVPRIIDNREIEVEGDKYLLKVELVVVTENLMVYLEIIPVQKQS